MPGSSTPGDPAAQKFHSDLSGRVPDSALSPLVDWFRIRRVTLKITRGRSSKSGDFRPPRNGSLPAITVNRTLNEYAFLITLVHEMAHCQVYEKRLKKGLLRRTRPSPPHGKEWKEEFHQLMQPFLTPRVMPEEVLPALRRHMKNPRASTYGDPHLAKALLRFDKPAAGMLIDELPAGALFITATGWLFRKEERLRKRIRCTRMKDRKGYLFSPLARVFPVEPEN